MITLFMLSFLAPVHAETLTWEETKKDISKALDDVGHQIARGADYVADKATKAKNEVKLYVYAHQLKKLQETIAKAEAAADLDKVREKIQKLEDRVNQYLKDYKAQPSPKAEVIREANQVVQDLQDLRRQCVERQACL
jgi:hypothetical protein